MSTPFICPWGHTWQSEPASSGERLPCPRCGAAGQVQSAPTAVPRETIPALDVPPPVPTPIIPGYEIVRELGRGGMGVVYLARQQKLRRLVALKMLRGGDFADPAALRRFQTEAEAVAAMQHPGIVQIHELGEVAGMPWFALEYVAGGTLADKLDGRPQPPRQAATLVAWLARAIDHAHCRGIIHRDLKPANVLVHESEGESGTRRSPVEESTGGLTPRRSPDVCFKITDFGLARRVDDIGMTLAGTVQGTPGFMAPEQAAGETQLGPAVDIHALGAILYNALTGRPPYLADTIMQTILQTMQAEPVAPARLVPGVPRNLDTICLKCLERDPRRRYARAADLADDLDRFLLGVPILARPAGTLERAWKWARRRPVPAAFIAVVVLGIIGFATTVLLFNRSLTQQRDRVRTLYDEAETARGEEQRLRREAEDRLLRQYLARSSRLLEEGDPLGALPYQVEALALDAHNAARQPSHRFRIGATLASCPRLVGLWRHAGAIHDLAWSADGKRLIVAHDGGVHVLDAGHGDELLHLPHPRPVERLALHPDGQTLATADAAGIVRTFDLGSGKETGLSSRHSGKVASLVYSPDGRRLLSAGSDGKAILRTQGMTATLTVDANSAILFAGFSPDGKRIVLATQKGEARVHRADTGAVLSAPLAHPYPVHHAVFSADGSKVYTACSSVRAVGSLGALTAWTLTETTATPRIFPRSRPVRHLALSADDKRLASALHSGQVVMWDVDSGEPTLHGLHDGPVEQIAFSADERNLVSASRDGSAIVWEMRNGALVRLGPALRHGGPVVRALFGGNGQQVATAGADGILRLWDLAPLAPGMGLFQPFVNRAVFSPEGRRVLTAGLDGRARVWDAATGSPRTGWLRHGQRIEQARFRPDGKQIVTVGLDGGIRLWDAGGELLWLRSGHTGAIRDVVFRGDGQVIVTAGDDGQVRRWRANDGKPIGEPIPIGARPVQLAFCAGDTRLFVFDNKGNAWLIAPDSPGQRKELGHTLDAAQVSRDGRWLAMADPTGLARLWQLDPLRNLGSPMTHRLGLGLLAFDAKGKQLATLSVDRKAFVREVPGGRVLAGPLANDDAEWNNQHTLLSAEFSADGSMLGVGTSSGQVRLWEVETGELAAPPWRLPYPATSSLAFQSGQPSTISSPRLVASAWSPDGSGVSVLREIEPPRLPVVELRRLAGVLSGRRIGNDGRLEPVPAEQLKRDFDDLLARHPDYLAVTAEEVRLWQRWQAESALQTFQLRGLSGRIDRMARADPTGWRPALLRGRLLAIEGKPAEAAVAFAQARRNGARDERLWTWEARCRLGSQDPGGYRRVCADALAQAGKTQVPELAGDVARLCLFRADAVADFAPVVALARRAQEHRPGDPELRAILGGALLRAGQSREARQQIDAASRAGSRLGKLLLALALAQAKEAEAARKLLAKEKRPAGQPELEALFIEIERTILVRAK